MNQKGKTLAKNTLMLYFRMLFTMVVAFFTSRVVLAQLGVNDFGIYNVVGGFVSMFSIISGSMTSSISRFLTFEIGKKNDERIKVVFSTSIFILLFLSIAVIILIEVFGVWFLYHKMTIAPERLNAAFWVLQCSALTFIVNMLSVPYNAAIIAHEKMQAFAYISILEVSLKLVVAYLLYVSVFDSLKFYAVLLAATSLCIRWVYSIYCRRHFPESKIVWKFDRSLVKELAAYSGWTFIGSSSGILRDQGVNLLLNIFGGTAVNAARGVASQVNNAVYNFSSNFMVAVNPQIVKLYAQDQREEMFSLVRVSTKFSYFLLLMLSLPILFEANPLIHLWLKVVPDYAVIFTKMVLIFSMSEALGIPLQFVNQATGKIRNYQLVVGGLQLMNFPVAYLALKFGASPVSVYIIAISISQICLFARMVMLRKTVSLDVKKYLKDVYFKIILVTILAIIIPLLLTGLLPDAYLAQWGWIIMVMICCIICSGVSILFVGCNQKERGFIYSKVKTIINKIPHAKSK